MEKEIKVGETVIFTLKDPSKGWEEDSWIKGEYLGTHRHQNGSRINHVRVISGLATPCHPWNTTINLHACVELIRVKQLDPEQDLTEDPDGLTWMLNRNNPIFMNSLFYQLYKKLIAREATSPNG